MALTLVEHKVLEFLRTSYSPDSVWPFRSIQEGTGLNRREVMGACRSLARAGLAMWGRGHCEVGSGSGSGYRAIMGQP